MLSNFAGINENNKPSSKVLRPPGGGSSDIFGSDVPSTPRSVKNHMQSNIFSCEKGSVKNNGDQPRRAQKNVDSYTRLFGDPERPFTPAKNHMKSSIPFGGTAAAAAAAAENGNGAANGNGLHASNGRNGKLESGGSSSSASSVSSSTENLKMNGLSKTEPEEMSVVSSPRPVVENGIQKDVEVVSHEKTNDNLSARSSASKVSEKTQAEGSSPNVSEKTQIEGSTPEVNSSEDTAVNSSEDTRSEVSISTSSSQKPTSATSGSQKSTPRNPITGLGLGDDGQRARRNNIRRDGNPVTGEGYKPAGAEINTTIPSLNGANQVINKNRIPPGGFSSGLW